MNVDITDLLKVDDRLSYGWREAEVDNGNLHIKFPSLGEYRILTDSSKVEDGTWYLQIECYWGIHAAIIDEQRYVIPKGVERIVIGNVIDVNKEKWTEILRMCLNHHHLINSIQLLLQLNLIMKRN